MKTFVTATVVAIAGLAIAGADTIVIKGSDTLGAKLVPQLTEQFKSLHAGTTFNIAAEGSATGFAALIDKTAAIGMASRPAKPEEIANAKAKGVELKETVVAYDGIAVIVNSANTVKGLTKKQVEQIFTGEVTDWSAVGGASGKISVYTRNTSSGTYAEFKELAMKKRDYAADSQKLAGNEQIDAASPSKESVLAKSYPYARPTFFYTNGEPTGAIKEFIDFTIGSEGQKIVEQVGFVPIK
jgi:phosphate transport system substrate-binding protein